MPIINENKGGRISIPARLYNQYLSEYKQANQILRGHRKLHKGTKNADSLSLRSDDLSKFKTRKSALGYIRTTHKIVTGKYFQEQASLYRKNLINAILTNNGYQINVTPTIFNIDDFGIQHNNPELYALVKAIAGMQSEKIATLELKSKVNLIGYQYQPENTSGEHIEYLIDLLDTPIERGGVAEEKNEFSNQIRPYIYNQLRKKGVAVDYRK